MKYLVVICLLFLLGFVDGATIQNVQIFCNTSVCTGTPNYRSELVLNECFLSCNPCLPGGDQCLYQTFQVINDVIYQSLFQDASCTTSVFAFQYGCGACEGFADGANALVADCSSTEYVYPITINFGCEDQDCPAPTPSNTTFELDKCFWGNDPCSPSMNSFQAFQLVGNVLTQNLFNDINCTELWDSEVYQCNICNSGSPNLTPNCNTQPAVSSITFNSYCTSPSCGGSLASTGYIPLDQCLYLCDPCNTTHCIYQMFHLVGNSVNQVIFMDVDCLYSAQTFNQTCNSCGSDDHVTSHSFSCLVSTTGAHVSTTGAHVSTTGSHSGGVSSTGAHVSTTGGASSTGKASSAGGSSGTSSTGSTLSLIDALAVAMFATFLMRV